MFDGHYKEKQASVIPIPNIRFCVFERMMRCIYTGAHLTSCATLQGKCTRISNQCCVHPALRGVQKNSTD